ncbi:UNVERIFIED_CONTAM: hypothetical protein NCL1_28851 [Trichonephila clavipes]
MYRSGMTVPGSPQFGFRRTSRTPCRFSSIAEGTSQGLPQKSSFSLEGLHNGSLKSNLPLSGALVPLIYISL